MKTYSALTLGELIASLEEKGIAPVEGLNGEVHSYRGYYERNATTPCNETHPADVLAEKYRSEIGKEITGWKGGDYVVSPDELIYYTQPGDTGAAIGGFEQGADGTWMLVGVDEHAFLWA